MLVQIQCRSHTGAFVQL